MKITFEDEYLEDICMQMENFLSVISRQARVQSDGAAAKPKSPDPEQDFRRHPGPDAVKPVEKPVDTPVGKPGRTAKQLENDERLRAAAKAKVAAKKAAKVQPLDTASMMQQPPPPATAESLGLDPAEVVKIRQKTIEDLQSAYANGFQKEVFELLSRFGNGAKSFRELPPDAFVPIREAIDNGALT